MSLLELKQIGKIYVSDGNVAVGIRGVNLSFDRGEFVAVTGKSGSGKSTLLNVISGMDTYEEGELLIDGEPTSHYMQKDWEEYRKQYISFIFQDYNIIESFTVLQNVELALMHIEDPRARRARAMELIRRVGLEKHAHHKGSKLSGGQKQRTVIARALAKDSPIILADEPTGNLDSKSSVEIIELLREVSKDKLVIVVTHNFDEVAACATRHVRIYDGAVEFDHTLHQATPVQESRKVTEDTPLPTAARTARHTLRNGLTLGRVRFFARPKLSIFLCILMTLTSIVLAYSTANSATLSETEDAERLFTYMKGRVVIARRDGVPITDDELAALAEEVGAEDYMHHDFMLDQTTDLQFDEDLPRTRFTFAYPAERVTPDAGRYPEAENEVLLSVPISYEPFFGRGDFEPCELPLLFRTANYTVTGVHYYYDNTQTPRLFFTEEGYKTASVLAFFSQQKGRFKYDVVLSVGEATEEQNAWENHIFMEGTTFVDFGMEKGSYFINNTWLQENINAVLREYEDKYGVTPDIRTSVIFQGEFMNYQYNRMESDYGYVTIGADPSYGTGYGTTGQISHSFDQYRLTDTVSESMKEAMSQTYYENWQEGQGISNVTCVIVSPDVLVDFVHDGYYTSAYTQASLFFENDRAAKRQLDALGEKGYTAVLSDATDEQDVYTVLLTRLVSVLSAFGWIISILFSTFFLHLCSSRAMNATRGDVAIMRSMGIPTRVVKVSIYVQTLITLIPAAIVTAAVCIAVYTIPKTNAMFPFLHAENYLLIAVVLVAIALNLARKYVKKMFNESVKKTLKGGARE